MKLKNMPTLPATLTEAAQKPYALVSLGVDATTSSVKIPSYADRYRQHAASTLETPIENIQRAAEDDERRNDIVNPASSR